MNSYIRANTFLFTIIFLFFISQNESVLAQRKFGGNLPKPSNILIQAVNLDFEDGELGKMPVGWEVPVYAVDAGYIASLTDIMPVGGRYCVELFHPGPYKEDMYGAISQSIDATPYLGKRIRLKAAVRAEISSPKGSAHLWIHEHIVGKQTGLIETMEDNPIVINAWDYYQIESRIDTHAEYLSFGLMLKGTGKAWIDNISIEILDVDSTLWEKPKIMSESELRNLTAFTNLYGIIRYFNPGDESLSTDWERFALDCVSYVEKAKDDAQLKEFLDNIFRPIVPSLELYFQKNIPNIPKIEKPPMEALKNISISWVQLFAGMINEKENISSKVVNIYQSQRDREGTVFQTIDAIPLRGKKIKIKSAVKIEPAGVESQAQLWLRIESENNKNLQVKGIEDFTITKNEWKDYSLECDIANDAKLLHIGLVLIGDGKAWFDNVAVEVYDGNKLIQEILPRNNDFEYGNSGEYVRSWIMQPQVSASGYIAVVTDKIPFKGKQCLLIESDTSSRIKMPIPGELFIGEIADGIYAKVPLTCFIDSVSTLPYPYHSLNKMEPAKQKNFIISGNDRISRLAITVIAWNIIKHFSLKKINDDRLNGILEECLTNASQAQDEKEFLKTLEKLNSILEDSQSRVWLSTEQERYGLPVLMRWINDKLIVTKTTSNLNNINNGDEIITIDGKPSNNYLCGIETLISGVTPQWKRLRALAELRSGDSGSKVTFGIKSSDGKINNITLNRNIQLNELIEDRPEKITEIKPGIFYIDITRVTDKTFMELIPNLQNAKEIIFDARGMSLLSEHFLGFFAPQPLQSFEWKIPVYTKPNHQLISYKTIKSRIELTKQEIKSKIIFLSDERSIGYTENLLEIVKHYNLGKIVGTQTAGTPGEIIPIRLPGGYTYTMTAIIGVSPSGEVKFGKPVEPTVKVENNINDIKNYEDTILKKAMSIIEKQQ